MRIPEETLMAYADGELEGETRAAVERAMREDPEIERRMQRHRNLRQQLQDAFAEELCEPLPKRLLATVRDEQAAMRGKVVDLGQPLASRAARTSASHMLWGRIGALAASLVIGLVLGVLWMRHGDLITNESEGRLAARGALASALSHQLSGETPADARVRVGLSFLSKSGEYCRAFSLQDPTAASGLACRSDGEWRIETLNRPGPESPQPAYRMAGSELDPTVLKAIEDRIAGEPLDQGAERAARDSGWSR